MGIRIQTKSEQSSATDMSQQALRLLQFESDIRELSNENSLVYHLTNQIPTLIDCRQILLFKRRSGRHKWRLSAISGTPNLHEHAPLVVALEALVSKLSREKRLGKNSNIESWKTEKDIRESLPESEAYWVPFTDTGKPDVGIIVTSNKPLSEQQYTLLKRIVNSYQYSWEKLNYGRPFVPERHATRWIILLFALVTALAFLPVRLNVLAPVEVIADSPFHLTAPINGVVKQLLVSPNTQVTKGAALVQFEDLTARNELSIASRRLAVAQARAQQVRAAAFTDTEAAHQLSIAQSEYQLAAAEYQFARDVLARTKILAPENGLVIYTDRRDWEGRAVQVGEEILQVADPSRIRYRIDLPTGNNISVGAGDDVSIYLENSPFGGADATLVSVSYQPTNTSQNIAAYTLIATPADNLRPRIGARGTARIHGEEVTLFYQIIRRPLAAVRQWLGV